MDEGLGDEMAPLNMNERAHLYSKENEYSIKPPESSNVLESHEIIIPGEGDYTESSFHVLADILDAKNLNRSGVPMDASEQLCTNPRFMDNAGNMVEELTVRNYDSSNLAIVGTSNFRERIQTRQGQWQHLYQLGGASGIGSSCTKTLYRDNGQEMSSPLEDARYASSPVFLSHKTSSDDCNEVVEQSANAKNKGLSQNMISHGGIRTKILSKSGFSEYFVKSTLKGKGIIFRGPTHEGAKLAPRNENTGKAATVTLAASNSSLNLGVKTTLPCSFGITGPRPAGADHDGIGLQHWLNARQHKVNKVDCLHIFKRIVDLVDYSHSKGVALHDLRPSCFKLLQSNQVNYIGSAVEKDTFDRAMDRDVPSTENHVARRRAAEQGIFPFVGILAKKQKFSENANSLRQWPLFTAKHGLKFETANDGDLGLASTQDSRSEVAEHIPNTEYRIQGRISHQLSNAAQQQLASITDRLEDKWYASPEELSEGICTMSSNIYSLGVLLFELLGHFDSERGHATAMADLRHRILPPHFLSENPKEAGFCLWLIHPEPSSRPTTREILQSEVINGLQEVSVEELSSSIDQDDAESELLLHFLCLLKEHKQNHASKLADEIRCIEADIGEVARRNCLEKSLANQLSCVSRTNDMRLNNIIRQLESAYFSMRSQIQLPKTDATTNQDMDVLRNRENCYFALEGDEKENPTDCLGSFFDGLCKYARYSKFEVRGLLRTGDFNNSANVICSLSFDRDMDYFATAGVSKKIKIFEFNSLLNDSVDIHYPVIEMSNKSKLSCICWNTYIKNYLASTDYDGVVKLWDANTGQGVYQYNEHERRAWSVDFSQVYPTKLASGGDDCTVKLWSINEKNSLGTIRNIANVCCVQFSCHSTHLLAFGSADYRTYCYDLRNVRTPWCVLAGHDKAVSYVKFLDRGTLVTASTDNSLKLWDLNKASSSGLSNNACTLTLSGHTNEKNFVGLSVADGYIACGSETNEVYAYHRSLPVPITSHKFGSIDPISGKETDDDNGQFVSSVSWRGKSDMLIAANSTGCIKVLQVV
ncbi:protein SPA1-RELATED 2 isoform X1 [Ricinus communis]|uniref:protein SPA1-RELATED 2 isoform X1 n=1 Tax=Ricinus communis TaxID=3988 RepID=UPI00201A3412|nr:protein SPA1-RELATED 2 isoform X1 [Ricinus communis]XP_015570973.2 protein SPA1-RELATED 2 isoform X1 [Ricinus communis]XP_015570978.2 protein SPA1-RELATED 2 isoform X1 [Ricinus communis]XP_048229802.1 protein SPA1-RELATED 2 isoform X1 [Ricinus communis]XP_048229803.1 protein SPA1-RELATED 2 isoform X1 [Ricinus communis]